MSCFHPLPAYVDRGSGGAPRIGYHAGEQGDKLELPCGVCVGCRMDRSRSWSIRMMHEAQLYDSNLFLTLDYSPEFLPKSLSLEYRDFQLFMKKLRKEVKGVTKIPNGKAPIRFFVAGEYGETYGRPHWHAILFNTNFEDKVLFHNGTYRSSTCERLWGNGNVVIGNLTPASAAYVAGYTLSKRYGRGAAAHYEDVLNLSTGEMSSRRPEFCQMSRDPGIGAYWYEMYGRDLLPHDFAVQDGKKYKVPRYYWNKFQAHGDANVIEDVTVARMLRAREMPLEERSDRRRAEREEVAQAKLKTFSQRRH